MDARLRQSHHDWSTGSTRCPARSATRLRDNLSHVLHNRRLTELVREVPIDERPAPICRPASTTARPSTRSSTTCSSGCCASGCWRRSSRRTRPARRGLRDRRRPAAPPARSGPGWPRTPATAGSGMVVPRHLGAGGRDVHTLALAAQDGAAAIIDVTAVDPDDDAALGAWFADPHAAQGRPRPQAGDQRPDRPRLAGRRDRLRHRAGRVPGPAGTAHLRPGRPGAAVPAPHPRPGSTRRRRAATLADRRGRAADDTADMVKARAMIDLAAALEANSGPLARSRCWPTWNCR